MIYQQIEVGLYLHLQELLLEQPLSQAEQVEGLPLTTQAYMVRMMDLLIPLQISD